MIAPWMLYATMIGCLLAAAAHALEHVAGERGWPRRWVWLVAVAALPLAPLLTSEPPQESVVVASRRSTTPGSTLSPAPVAGMARTTADIVAPPTPAQALVSGVARIGRALIRIAAIPAVAVRRAQSHLVRLVRFDGWLLWAWAGITSVLLGMYIVAAVKLADRRRRWLSVRVDGEAVLVAPDAGPAVVGALRPAIVLPAWTLGIDAPRRSLILRHEREHMRAYDPLVLHFVTLTAYLLPWNIAVWWMLRRLRIAVELDCDRRVLRAGGDAHRYADLLLTVGSRRSGARRVLVPALVERQSLLARRILAMCPQRAKFQRLRSTCAAGVAYVLLTAAYAVPMPALKLQQMHVTSHGERWQWKLSDGSGLLAVAVDDSSKVLLTTAAEVADNHTAARGNRPGDRLPKPPRDRATVKARAAADSGTIVMKLVPASVGRIEFGPIQANGELAPAQGTGADRHELRLSNVLSLRIDSVHVQGPDTAAHPVRIDQHSLPVFELSSDAIDSALGKALMPLVQSPRPSSRGRPLAWSAELRGSTMVIMGRAFAIRQQVDFIGDSTGIKVQVNGVAVKAAEKAPQSAAGKPMSMTLRP